MAQDPGTYTPYSTIMPLVGDMQAGWAPELDRERVLAYQKYDEIYWSHTDAFRLVMARDTDRPIYVPNPVTIVDTTSHFWMKGLDVHFKRAAKNEASPVDPEVDQLSAFLAREMFLSKFHTAKHSGVSRGDFILHVTADPMKPDGSRVSVNSVDPAAYFPEYDDDNLERVLAVNLIEQVLDPDDPTKVRISRLRYYYDIDPDLVTEGRKVFSEETVWEVSDWWNPKGKLIATVVPAHPLPAPINTIPVYHFKNKDWQGQPFGSSELRGYEMIQAGINQGTTDEHLALALEGLGVYYTDSAKPVDSRGQDVEWEVAPGRVMQIAGDFFKRVEGISSVKPFQDHLEFLVNSMYESTATFRGGTIDAQIAESGIALAIRFLPTQAKLEQRDQAGKDKLQQFFFDWKNWMLAYENAALRNIEIEVTLGDKLPTNKTDMLNLLNNMVDRNVIPRSFYREQVTKVYGMQFPADIDDLLAKEAEERFKEAQKRAELGAPPDGGPNNKTKPNESGGTEATQPVSRQVQPSRQSGS